MKFKVGDKVRVRRKYDLRQVTRTIDKQREKYAGELLTIAEILGSNYITEETEVWWADEMLEPIQDPLAAKVIERNNKPTANTGDPWIDNLPKEYFEMYEVEEQEKSLADEYHNPIKPSHYRKGEIDLYESWYRTYPFNEFRAGMQMIAERYMKRDKNDRVEDIEKARYTLERLKEYEVQHGSEV